MFKIKKVDKVALLGFIVGFFAFLLSFLVVRPNRIANGTSYKIWDSISNIDLMIIIFLYLIILCMAILNSKNHYINLFTGIVGNVLLVMPFFLAARGAEQFVSAENPSVRISLGLGVWLMAFSANIIILSAQKKSEKKNFLKLMFSMPGILLMIIIVLSGLLNQLSLLKEFSIREDRFIIEFYQHLTLTGSAVAFAVIVGVLLGILAYRKKIFDKPVFAFVNTVQTIPSLALFGLMIAPLSMLSQRYSFLRELGIRGIGWAPALIALTLYALLPIVRNTYTSLKVIDPGIIESGLGMGMNKIQLLFKIQIPLSLPIVLSGIRTALVQSVGNTTVAALIGAGGFGVFVFQGLGQAVPDLILLGAIPVILLAVFVDKFMEILIQIITPKGIFVEQES